MKGLLLKEFYVSIRVAGGWCFAILIICMTPFFRTLGNVYAILEIFILLINVVFCDVSNNWDLFAATLPCSIEEIMLSKYLITAFYILPAGAIVLLGEVVQTLRELDTVNWVHLFRMGLLILWTLLLGVSIIIPVFYRYGTLKGRVITVTLLLTGFISICTAIYFSCKYEPPSLLLPLITLPPLLIAAVLAAVLLAVLPVSFRLSVRFYQNRRYGAYDCG